MGRERSLRDPNYVQRREVRSYRGDLPGAPEKPGGGAIAGTVEPPVSRESHTGAVPTGVPHLLPEPHPGQRGT